MLNTTPHLSQQTTFMPCASPVKGGSYALAVAKSGYARLSTPSLVLRLIFSTGLALLITLSLFIMMKFLITPDSALLVQTVRDLPVVALYEPPKETEVDTRQPLPPKPEITPPEMRPSSAEPIDTAAKIEPSGFSSVIEIVTDGPTLLTGLGEKMATPLVRVEPRFPVDALRQGISGWVVLNFSIDETGSVSDIQVISAEPRSVFDREAIRALRRWKYQPQIINGKAVKQENLQVQLDFQLQQE